MYTMFIYLAWTTKYILINRGVLDRLLQYIFIRYDKDVAHIPLSLNTENQPEIENLRWKELLKFVVKSLRCKRKDII